MFSKDSNYYKSYRALYKDLVEGQHPSEDIGLQVSGMR